MWLFFSLHHRALQQIISAIIHSRPRTGLQPGCVQHQFLACFRSSVNKEMHCGQTCLICLRHGPTRVFSGFSPLANQKTWRTTWECFPIAIDLPAQKAKGNIFLSGGETITTFSFFLKLARRNSENRPDRLISGVRGILAEECSSLIRLRETKPPTRYCNRF